MNNRTNEKFNEDYFVVTAPGTAIGTGATAGEGVTDPATGALRITNGAVQIMFEADGKTADGKIGTLAAASTDLVDANGVAQAQAISVLLGTPNSANTSELYGWHYEAPPFYKSGILRYGKILSVTRKAPRVGTLSATYLTDFPDDLPGTAEYTIFLEARSVRRDRDYGANVENWFANFRTPDWDALGTATGGPQRAYTLAGIARNLNMQSRLYSNGKGQRGNRDFVVLGIGASGGTAISALDSSAGTPIDVMTYGGQTLQVPVTPNLVETMIQAVAVQDAGGNALLPNTQNIVTIDGDDLTQNTDLEGLLIIGLPEERSKGLDNIYAVGTRIDVEAGRTFASLPVNRYELVDPQEPYGHGNLLRIDYERRAFAGQGTFQLAGHSDELVLPPNPIDVNKWYEQTIIDFWDEERTLTVTPYYPKRLHFLNEFTLTAAATNDFAAATAYDGSFNDFLGAWLDANPDIEYLGDAENGSVFV